MPYLTFQKIPRLKVLLLNLEKPVGYDFNIVLMENKMADGEAVDPHLLK